MGKLSATVLVTDLDNTLYDWFEFWYHSFVALLDRLAADSGIARDVLIREIKQVHEKHHTAEYAFLVQELPSLQNLHSDGNIAEIYDDAIHEYRRARKRHLKLYPGVMETLATLKADGVLLIGYTESMGFYSASRVRSLGLDGILDYLYSPADHALPLGLSRQQVRMFAPDHYGLERTEQRYTPPGEVKPNPAVLLDILGEVGGSVESSIYIGDSLVKDVLMAQQAGVTDVHAKYGTAHTREEYELLRAVTHWTAVQVEREKVASSRTVQPSFTLERSFGEVLDLFEFYSLNRPPIARVRM